MSHISEDIGFVLHARRYRENSRIIDVFTRSQGRIALVARIPKKKGGRDMAALQSYTESLFTWRGKNELKNLVSVDAQTKHLLSGENSICGLYCNELILYLLDKELPFPELYHAYSQLLLQLSTGSESAISLRRFEGVLLHQLGFALDLELALSEGEANNSCYFHPETGLSTYRHENAIEVSASVLSNLAQESYSDRQTARISKAIFGSILNGLLEGRKLRSRTLLQSYRKYKQ